MKTDRGQPGAKPVALAYQTIYKTDMTKLKTLLPAIIFVFGLSLKSNGQTGTLAGSVFDETSGELLLFANITIKNANSGEDVVFDYGQTTDLDGTYIFKDIPIGTYNLTASYTAYAPKVIEALEVREGEVTSLDIGLADEVTSLVTIVVSAGATQRSENALMALQRKAPKIQDGISSQEMSRFGSSNAAESMKKVTGASVLDGKYVFLRGIGDRYNSTQLNGQLLPSTDPYRNATQLDLIPANLLESVVAYKTFTPDQPGHSTGGSLNITTKSFPKEFTFDISLSTSYNTVSSNQDGFLTYEGGHRDWLGYDDGTRKLPSAFDEQMQLLTINRTSTIRNRLRQDEALANRFDRAMRSISNQMEPSTRTSPMNMGANISIGNQFNLLGNPLGVLFSAGYTRDFSHYDNGDLSFYELTRSGGLLGFYDLKETRSTENPVVGSLLNLSYKFSNAHKVSFNALYNHNATKSSAEILGRYPGKISGNSIYRSRLLYFNEREILNLQLMGEHAFGKKGGLQFDWFGGYVHSTQIEPDSRVFDNTITEKTNLDRDGNLVTDLIYGLDESEFQLPFHFWRDLADEQYNGGLNITVPILRDKGNVNKLQFGLSYSEKSRDFNDMELKYENVKSRYIQTYDGDSEVFFGPDNLGVARPENGGNLQVGMYLENQLLSTRKNSYTGSEKIGAAYGMATLGFGPLRVIGGARIEQTDISVASKDTNLMAGGIEETDVLPSLNLIYALSEKMNLRGAVTKTLARPNMRELSPFSSFDRGTDIRLFGNPNLKRTLINNYDLRWEFYPTSGELIAVSAFYKSFQDPIIKTFNPLQPNKQIKFDNVGTAEVYGLEVEFRKKLGFISPLLSDFRIISNLSLIESVVDIPGAPDEVNTEQYLINLYNPGKGFTRPFQGQSPYLVNASLNYFNLDSGIDAIISFNVFGERLILNNGAQSPDFYEQPINQLDFSFRKSFGSVGIKLSVRNILDSDYLQTVEFEGDVRNIESQRRGVGFGLGFTYSER